MIDAQSTQVLQDIVRRESLSLLQYVGEAFPWIKSSDAPALAAFQRIASEQRDAVTFLAGWLAKKRIGLNYLGSFPSGFTHINYCTLDYLLPLVLDSEKKKLADFERDLTKIADPDAVAMVRNMVELKRRHVQMLADLKG